MTMVRVLMVMVMVTDPVGFGMEVALKAVSDFRHASELEASA